MSRQYQARQTPPTTTSTPRSFRQATDEVDLSDFKELNLRPLPAGTKPTGTLNKSLKRIFLLRDKAIGKGAEIVQTIQQFQLEHIEHHFAELFDPHAPTPNCAEHAAETEALKMQYEAAKRDFRKINQIFRATVGYEFDLGEFSDNADIEVFKGGEFVFTPEKTVIPKISGLEGVPGPIAEIVRQVAEELGATKVTVQRVDASSNAPHADILELIRQFDQVSGSRNAGRGSDNGRPQPSHFAQQAAAAERNGQ